MRKKVYVTNAYWHGDWYWGKLFVLYSNGTYDTWKFDNFKMELKTNDLKMLFFYGNKNGKSISAKKFFNARSMHNMTKAEAYDYIDIKVKEWRDLMKLYEPWFDFEET